MLPTVETDFWNWFVSVILKLMCIFKYFLKEKEKKMG